MTATQLPILLDCHEVAALLGVSLRKFRDMTKDEGFPAGRVLGPRSTRWVRTEVEAYVASLPTAKHDEPQHLAAARAAKAAGQPAAHAPFPPSPQRPQKAWKEVRG